MSEPVAKDRRTVELDDFERRLRRRDGYQEDPLAELARLVGETSDPYGEVFAQEATAASRRTYPHSEPLHPDPLHSEVSPRLSGDFAAIEAGLRSTLPDYPEAHPYDSEGQHEFYAQHEQYARDEAAAQHAAYGAHGQPYDPYAQHGDYDRRHEDDHHLAGSDLAPGPMPVMAPLAAPAPRSRRPMFGIIAAIVLGVIGVGVAFAYKGSSSSPREIKTIEAASGPTKVQPPAETASRQDGQDSALLNKGSAQPTPTKLVNGEEQPVDISAAVQENASRDADAGASAPGDASNVPVPPAPSQYAAAQGVPSGADAAMPPIASGTPAADQMPGFGLAEMPAPKKVKVVSVRPDGTILPNDPPAASSPPAAASDTSQGEAATPAAKAGPKSATPKTTSRVASGAKSTKTAAATDGTDTASAKPARKLKLKKVAALAPAADATGAADVSPASSGSGGFAVQLAAPGSEAEAHSATSRLAKKFASALDGRHLGVRKAQSNGKSVFRVRVSSLTKEDAVSLCEKLKAEGGTCFIAKN